MNLKTFFLTPIRAFPTGDRNLHSISIVLNIDRNEGYIGMIYCLIYHFGGHTHPIQKPVSDMEIVHLVRSRYLIFKTLSIYNHKSSNHRLSITDSVTSQHCYYKSNGMSKVKVQNQTSQMQLSQTTLKNSLKIQTLPEFQINLEIYPQQALSSPLIQCLIRIILGFHSS